MLPPVADQLMVVLVVPVTVALNCCVPPTDKEADVGDKFKVICATGVVTSPQPANNRVTNIPMQMLTRSHRRRRLGISIRLSLHDTKPTPKLSGPVAPYQIPKDRGNACQGHVL